MNEPVNNHKKRIYLYTPHSWVRKAIEIGWVVAGDLGPPHNSYSILMEWKHEGEPVMPFNSREKRDERR